MAQHGSGGFLHSGEDGCILANLQMGDIGVAGVILMVARKVVEEVADGVDFEAGEFFGGFGVDAPEAGDGVEEGLGVGWGRGVIGRGCSVLATSGPPPSRGWGRGEWGWGKGGREWRMRGVVDDAGEHPHPYLPPSRGCRGGPDKSDDPLGALAVGDIRE